MGISLCCSLSGPCLVFARKQTLSNRQRSILGQHSGGDCNAVFTGRDERDRWDSRYKNPEPLHARARDVKELLWRRARHLQNPSQPTRLPLQSIADEDHRCRAIALVARRQALRANYVPKRPIRDYLRTESGAVPDGLRVQNFHADKVRNGC
jgi:hypothetical protein